MTAPKRKKLTAASTVLDQVIPKPGLDIWKVQHTAEGATIAARAGEDVGSMTGKELLAFMKHANIGADAIATEAAERGIGCHSAIERYMRTGGRELPDPLRDKIDIELWGFHHAASDWLQSAEFEPVSIETIVADPAGGNLLRAYAGRLDLRARVNGKLYTLDFTTHAHRAIRARKVFQALLYERGARVCGDEPADGIMVVAFGPDRKFRVYERAYNERATDRLLDWREEFKPVESECESANRRAKAEGLIAAEPDETDTRAAEKVERVEGDPSTYPGAMKRTLRRSLPNGDAIEYVESPKGWTTQKGTRRQTDFRAYYWYPAVQAELPVAA